MPEVVEVANGLILQEEMVAETLVAEAVVACTITEIIEVAMVAQV
jgi:hypothetical protein